MITSPFLSPIRAIVVRVRVVDVGLESVDGGFEDWYPVLMSISKERRANTHSACPGSAVISLAVLSLESGAFGSYALSGT